MPSSVIHHCPSCGYDSLVIATLITSTGHPCCQQCGLSASEAWDKMQDDLSVLFSRQKIVEYEAKNSIPRLQDGKASNLVRFPSSAAHSIPQHYRQCGSQPLQSDMGGNTDCEARTYQFQGTQIRQEFPEDFSQAAVDNSENRLYHIPGDAGHEIRSIALRDNFLYEAQRDLRAVAADIDMSDLDHHENTACDTKEAEPYMASGYAAPFYSDDDVSASEFEQKSYQDLRLPDEPTTGFPYRLSSDPIYSGSRWLENRESEPIEYQYGKFEQMNQFEGHGTVAP